MMDARELLDPFERLLEDIASPARVREIEAGAPAGAMWEAFAESGFLDALVPEDAGGAGLALSDVQPLLQALGRHAVPVPVAETMVARALLAPAGVAMPAGPIVLATLTGNRAIAVPVACLAEHALVQSGGTLVLAEVTDAELGAKGVHHSLAADLCWANGPSGPSIAAPVVGLRPICAVLRAAAIAGAADRLLGMSVAYANERVQFGKPIGKQQAIQQQLAVMAEQAAAARIAAQIGCSAGFPPAPAQAATAKQVTSSAAVQIANIAHAVHGAIGMSEEYDLQLYSRRLHEWRLADGSEGYWATLLGSQRLGADISTVDFVRLRIEQAEPAA
jgi:acyl-CoA dehydrogenase